MHRNSRATRDKLLLIAFIPVLVASMTFSPAMVALDPPTTAASHAASSAPTTAGAVAASVSRPDEAQRRHETEARIERRSARLHWNEGVLRLRIEAEVPEELSQVPTAAQRVQRRLERFLEELFLDSINHLQLNSAERGAARLDREAELTNRVRDIRQALQSRYTGPRPDLGGSAIEYELDLYAELIRSFQPHQTPRPVPRVPGWRASREFTGVVIYATDELPVHGSDRSAQLVPALLPRLHDDERYELAFSPAMVEPEFLERWGPVAYAEAGSEARLVERVGNNPLRVLASGLYGETPTDLMIPRDDILRLLSRENNRRLLAEGRIVIVLPPSQTEERLISD